MKKTFFLKGRLVKASLADAVLSELGRGWGRHFRQRVRVNRGEWHELLGSGERRGTRARVLLCKGHLCTHDVVSRPVDVFRASSTVRSRCHLGFYMRTI